MVLSDGHMHGSIIEFIEFNEEHTGRNIADKVTTVIDQYGLHGKIIAIVLDNAKANDKAIAYISNHLNLNESTYPTPHELHVRCFGHALNLASKGNSKGN